MIGQPRWPARVVWAAWALLSGALLLLVAVYGRNVPYWDDWKLVCVLLGGQPPSLDWFWVQGNEHRLPVSKAIMYLLASLSGGELRGAMFAAALLLCAVTALLLASLNRLSGRLVWTDLLLPVALLNWGHQSNVLWQIQLHFVLAVALFVGTLVVLLHLVQPTGSATDAQPARLGERTWPLFALALLLPWASGVGLCLSLVLVPWMAWGARLVPGRLRRALNLCAALLAVSVAVLLANRPVTPESHPGFLGIAGTLATALRCLATALGPVGRELWPASGLLVALVLAASALLLVRVMRRDPEHRFGASVLLAGLAATASLALVIGISRAGLGWEAGFAPRYTSTMAPGLCCAYLAWRLYGTGPRSRGLLALLCLVVCLALPFNTGLGLRDAQRHAAELDAFAADVRAGRPADELARVHGSRICPSETRLVADLELLRQRRLWLYRSPK